MRLFFNLDDGYIAARDLDDCKAFIKDLTSEDPDEANITEHPLEWMDGKTVKFEPDIGDWSEAEETPFRVLFDEIVATGEAGYVAVVTY